MRNKDICGLNRCHKAGIKAHELELVGHFVKDRCESLVKVGKGKGIILVLFVKANACNASAAVVPENNAHFVGRVILHAPSEEVLQRLLLTHICI